MALNLKITVGCRSCTDPSFLKKLVHTSWTPWSTLQKKSAAVGTSTRTDACACAGEPQLFPSLSVPDGSDSRGTCAHVSTPCSMFRNTPGKVAHMWDALVRVSGWKSRDMCSMLDTFVRVSRHSWETGTNLRLLSPCFTTPTMKE